MLLQDAEQGSASEERRAQALLSLSVPHFGVGKLEDELGFLLLILHRNHRGFLSVIQSRVRPAA